MIKVKDFMTRKIKTITQQTTIREIAHIFLSFQVGFLPVVDEEMRLLGEITKKDILAPFLPDYFDLLEDITFISDFGSLENLPLEILENLIVAEDIMIKSVVTINQEASLFKVIALMAQHDIRHIPVVEKGRLIGIISRTDILRVIFEQKGFN